MNSLIEKIESEQFKAEITPFEVGDNVKVHTRVKEGDKERVQVFAGIVIARKGRGLNAMFTVRRISYGEGVERVFPLHSPRIERIQVERKGKVRRAKLYYLRDLKGKDATTVKEDKSAPKIVLKQEAKIKIASPEGAAKPKQLKKPSVKKK